MPPATLSRNSHRQAPLALHAASVAPPLRVRHDHAHSLKTARHKTKTNQIANSINPAPPSCHARRLLLRDSGKQRSPGSGVLVRAWALPAADAEVPPLHKVQRQQLHNGLRHCRDRQGWRAWVGVCVGGRAEGADGGRGRSSSTMASATAAQAAPGGVRVSEWDGLGWAGEEQRMCESQPA